MATYFHVVQFLQQLNCFNESGLLVLLATICLTSKSLNGLSLGSLVLLKMPGTSNLETYSPELVAFHGDLPW